MKIFYGDNQFLGVNHLSTLKSSEYLERFSTPEDVAVVLKLAYSSGLRDFMFTAHPKTLSALELVYSECPFKLHICLPYAHSINDLINEKGVFGAAKSFLTDSGFLYTLKAGLNALRGKYQDIISIVLKHEIKQYESFHISSINLLNVATDFLLGSARQDILTDFYYVVNNKLGKKAGFFTMNYVMLSDYIWGDKEHLESQIIFNANPGGFRMNPSYEKVMANVSKYNTCDNIAMSLFSSGSTLTDASKFLEENSGFSGVLFGSASPENIKSSFNTFYKINS